VRIGTKRVVVSDRDPFVNGALAHLLGVGLQTALRMESAAAETEVSVEVLGATDLANPRMAGIQSQPFSARHVNFRGSTDHVVQIVTLTGCSDDTDDVEFLRRCNSVAVSLARFDRDGSWEHCMMHVDDTRSAFDTHPQSDVLVADIGRFADLCQAAAIALAQSIASA